MSVEIERMEEHELGILECFEYVSRKFMNNENLTRNAGTLTLR